MFCFFLSFIVMGTVRVFATFFTVVGIKFLAFVESSSCIGCYLILLGAVTTIIIIISKLNPDFVLSFSLNISLFAPWILIIGYILILNYWVCNCDSITLNYGPSFFILTSSWYIIFSWGISLLFFRCWAISFWSILTFRRCFLFHIWIICKFFKQFFLLLISDSLFSSPLLLSNSLSFYIFIIVFLLASVSFHYKTIVSLSYNNLPKLLLNSFICLFLPLNNLIFSK